MNKKDIAIYGFGGFGREIACVIDAINNIEPTWNLIGYFDDGYTQGDSNRYGKVLGGLETLNVYPRPLAIVMAIASPVVIQKIIKNIHNNLVYYPNIIAPNVLFFNKESVLFGEGNVITFGGRISSDVKIGNFNLMNGCVSLGHDVQIGDFNMLQPEVRISGETMLGNANFFGVRSTVLQGLKIGNNVKIGAASVVMRKTKDGMTYFGNPAKIMKIN